jgi:hypothetical protein
MPAALAWARHALSNGMHVVGASSLSHDPARPYYSDWTPLPWIGDADFPAALRNCIEDQRIGTVFTPHPVVWSALRQILPELAPQTRLQPERLWADELSEYRSYREFADRFHQQPLIVSGFEQAAAMLAPVQLAALVRMFQQVPGQCDLLKLEALAAIFRQTPLGDIVEIGSLWGRSALALTFLAKHYQLGNVLCVDPWSNEEILQGIPEVDAVFGSSPLEEIFDAFCVNLAPFAGRVNYIRARSEEAAARYQRRNVVGTEEFGRTTYLGQIALLHIDGNHALEAVQRDISTWMPFVRPGGWIVLDDYVWPFGSGPRGAADELLERQNANVATAFVAGGALFIRIKPYQPV